MSLHFRLSSRFVLFSEGMFSVIVYVCVCIMCECIYHVCHQVCYCVCVYGSGVRCIYMCGKCSGRGSWDVGRFHQPSCRRETTAAPRWRLWRHLWRAKSKPERCAADATRRPDRRQRRLGPVRRAASVTAITTPSSHHRGRRVMSRRSAATS